MLSALEYRVLLRKCLREWVGWYGTMMRGAGVVFTPEELAELERLVIEVETAEPDIHVKLLTQAWEAGQL